MNRVFLTASALAAITIGVYWQVIHHDFIDFDDPKPNFAEALNNLGAALCRQGRRDEARAYFLEAVRIKPDYDDALHNLALDSGSQSPVKQSP
jgi:tetratricopeptide (TPR) repeat protein